VHDTFRVWKPRRLKWAKRPSTPPSRRG
jgi:hypothetical protein